MIERLAARLHVLRPLAFQASVAFSPAVLLLATLGLAGVVQAVLAAAFRTGWPLLRRPRRTSAP